MVMIHAWKRKRNSIPFELFLDRDLLLKEVLAKGLTQLVEQN
jgi:hypothetical protein